jgi:hypothetical protein
MVWATDGHSTALCLPYPGKLLVGGKQSQNSLDEEI